MAKAIEKMITLEDAKKLPNMLGIMASASLKAKGWYGYTRMEDGQKIMLRLKK